MKIGKYETHPACDLFPLLGEPELSELAEDIRANGLLEPVILYEGKILDGRNRLLACQRAGVAPRFEAFDWTLDVDPITWVLSVNLRRRHLDESQRGMIARRLQAMFEEEARKRQDAGREAGGHARHGDGSMVANLPPTQKSRDQSAALLNVSPRTVQSAGVVIDHGTPDLVAAVDSGKVAVSTAATIATAPPERQQEILALAPPAIVDAAKGIRREKQADRIRQQKVIPFDRLISEVASDLHKFLHAERDPRMEKINVVLQFRADAPPLKLSLLVDALEGVRKRAGAIADQLKPLSRWPGE